ncbi:cleavage and polyadenylation specificity factor subunit 6-like [Macrobrachium rosenbergii]|uniref:cleavage and polyadenylation specificity factor subunit 6-like n=1 Tax=Macrobrachium rosenbergii TaxID=79674 RepID=UPI0034D75C95
MKSLLLFGALGVAMVSAQGPGPQPPPPPPPCPNTDYSCKCERLMGLKPPRGFPPPPPRGGAPQPGASPPPPPRVPKPQPGGSVSGRPPPPDSPKDRELRDNIKKQCFNGTEPSGQEPVLTDAQKNCIFNLFMTSKGVIVGGVINQQNAISFMTSSVEEQAALLGLSSTAVTAVKAKLSEGVQACYTTYSTKDQIPDFRALRERQVPGCSRRTGVRNRPSPQRAEKKQRHCQVEVAKNRLLQLNCNYRTRGNWKWISFLTVR